MTATAKTRNGYGLLSGFDVGMVCYDCADVGAYDPALSLADGELPAFQQEIERKLVAYHEAKDKEQERMDRIESRKAIVASVSKSKRNV